MTKLSHQIQGFAFSVSVFLFTHDPLLSIAFYVGNLFPDVDVFWNDMSSFGSRWYSHRGITHSLMLSFFLLLTSVLFILGEKFELYSLPSFSSPFLKLSLTEIPFFFSVGTLNHLFFDSMSPTGVPLKLSYYPRFRLWNIYKTRTVQEVLLVMFSSAFVLFLATVFNLDYIRMLTSVFF